MDVTIQNFKEVLKKLHEVIPKASFLAIDGEFTGLKTTDSKNTCFDTPEEYYEKLLSGSLDFLFCQLGLSVFTFNDETKRYSQETYNFYVFPRPYNPSFDTTFLCQASSITFLTEQGFDFNKLFKFGIPYLTAAEEERLVKQIEDRNENKHENDLCILKKDQPRIQEICQKIEEFLETDDESLVIKHCNRTTKRLVQQEARRMFLDKIRLEMQDKNLVVTMKGTAEEEAQLDKERKEKEKQDLQDAVGLSTLLRMIADSGKLIVGHNMLLDLFHIVHQFFSKLPSSYDEFKVLLHSLFPRLLDTKVICESAKFREIVPSSNLEELFETVSKAPFCIPEVDTVQENSYTRCAKKIHEAGYDAYMTGLCFIALSNYLGTTQDPPIETVFADSPLMKQYLNKLLIARLKDVPYINLTGEDPQPNRDNVFHLTFPATWKWNNIYQLFKPFGEIQVGWINDTSAYVKVLNSKNVPMVKKTLNSNNTYTITTFKNFIKKSKAKKSNEETSAQSQKAPAGSTSNNESREEDWQKVGNVSRPIDNDKKKMSRKKKGKKAVKADIANGDLLDNKKDRKTTNEKQVESPNPYAQKEQQPRLIRGYSPPHEKLIRGGYIPPHLRCNRQLVSCYTDDISE